LHLLVEIGIQPEASHIPSVSHGRTDVIHGLGVTGPQCSSFGNCSTTLVMRLSGTSHTTATAT
jgi:hypothetical protein